MPHLFSPCISIFSRPIQVWPIEIFKIRELFSILPKFYQDIYFQIRNLMLTQVSLYSHFSFNIKH